MLVGYDVTYICKLKDNISRTLFKYANTNEIELDSDKWQIEIAYLHWEGGKKCYPTCYLK
jgi:hypothetical protein